MRHAHESLPLKALLVVLALLASAPRSDAATAGRVIQGIEHRALNSDAVELTLKLSEPPDAPLVFTVDNPARLAIDLPDTGVALEKRYEDINSGPVRAVATAEGKGRSRVVIELLRLVPYEVQTRGNDLVITVGGGVTLGAPATAGGGPGVRPAPARRGPTEIVNVDFRRGDKGEGRVIIELSDSRSSVDVRDQSGQVVADFRNTRLPQALAQRLDVIDFATPVKFVEIGSDDGDAQVRVTPIDGGLFEQTAYQTGNQFTIELQPLSEEEKEARKKAETKFTGERLSLNFQNVDVRSLIQIIADVAETNIVVDDSVQGNMALRMDNVPWDQALDIVMKARGLDKRQNGDVIFIAPAAELAKREESAFKAEDQRIRLAPLISELIQVNYAKAEEIAKVLKPSGNSATATSNAQGSGINANSILSDRGRVTVDERTNTLLVSDTREKMAEIRALVKVLDVPVRQVQIESRVVIANDNFAKQLGARFGATGVRNTVGTTTGVTGSSTGADSIIGGAIPGQADRFNTNLPVLNPAGRIGLAILGADYLVDLELTAMQNEGTGELVSSPRVVTTDRKEAYIKQGVSIPTIIPGTANQPPTVVYIDALLNLTVTPSITPDDDIIMDLRVTKDEPDFTVLVLGQPIINKREILNQVLVKNGETAVLGGVFETNSQTAETKVPVLGDIPVVGRLFKNNNDRSERKELLIFITPKIIKEIVQLK